MLLTVEDDLSHYLADRLVIIYKITWHHFSEYSNLHETQKFRCQNIFLVREAGSL
jgi:hypothetical protein